MMNKPFEYAADAKTRDVDCTQLHRAHDGTPDCACLTKPYCLEAGGSPEKCSFRISRTGQRPQKKRRPLPDPRPSKPQTITIGWTREKAPFEEILSTSFEEFTMKASRLAAEMKRQDVILTRENFAAYIFFCCYVLGAWDGCTACGKAPGTAFSLDADIVEGFVKQLEQRPNLVTRFNGLFEVELTNK